MPLINRNSRLTLLALALSASALAGCAALPDGPSIDFPATRPEGATTQPLTQEAEDSTAWDDIAAGLKRTGVLKDNVYIVTVPRTDLDVSIEGMDVPAAAGIASEFRFYRCPCGKMNVIGQFCIADYEANDVIDSLRQGHFIVASLGPMLLYERPRLLLARFQSEGEPAALAKTLREALSWTGKERSGTPLKK